MKIKTVCFYFVGIVAIALTSACYSSNETTSNLAAGGESSGKGGSETEANAEAVNSPPEELVPESLKGLADDIEAGKYGRIHSLLIMHKGELIFEKYGEGWRRNKKHIWHSVSKSITSVLIGMAIERGIIENVDINVCELFADDYPELKNDSEFKKQIQLKHLLTMTAGFEWDEQRIPYSDPKNSLIQMKNSNDWVRHMLDLPVDKKPGSQFLYNSGGTTLMAGIIKKQTGKSLKDFAGETLFKELDIKDFSWSGGPNDITWASSMLHLRPIDMLKIGQLLLNNGQLDGKSIVNSEWIKTSTGVHVSPPNSGIHYGYQWWRFADNQPIVKDLDKNDVYFGWGIHGQFLFVIPHLDLVVVSNAANAGKATLIWQAFTDHIFDAIKE